MSANHDRVLIIEDNAFNLNLLREALAPECKVLVAKTGEHGLQLANADPQPDLILLDILLPGMDGYEVCRQLKANTSTADIPVIFVTVMGQEHDESKGLEIGAIDYIVKPLKPELVRARVRNHLALRRAQAREAEVVHAREDFLTLMSHELRTPVNAIMGMADVLSDGNLSEDQHYNLHLLRNASQGLLDLINNLLDLSRVEAGKLDLEMMEYDVVELVERLGDLLGIPCNANDSDLYTYVAPEVPPRLIGDPIRLRQILANLVGNAIKFTKKGEVVLHVEKRERDGAERLLFTVADTGMGIPSEKVGDLFSPFVQADRSISRSYGGSGLGLAITKRLVDLMKGTVSVQSSTGRGTIFQVELALLCPPGVTATRAPVVDDLDALVVDASFWGRTLVPRQLADMGVHTDVACDLESAHRYLEDRRAAGQPPPIVCVNTRIRDAVPWARGVHETGLAERLMLLVSPMEAARMRAQVRFAPGIELLIKPVHRSAFAIALKHPQGSMPKPKQTGRTRASSPELTRPLRVLIVEDSYDNQRLLSIYLRSQPCTIDMVDSGRVALDRCRNAVYDLILMDLEMPDMGGVETIRRIRELEIARSRDGGSPLENLPIVVMTAHTDERIKAEAMEVGCTGFLVKPIERQLLVEIVASTAAQLGLAK